MKIGSEVAWLRNDRFGRAMLGRVIGIVYNHRKPHRLEVEVTATESSKDRKEVGSHWTVHANKVRVMEPQ